jgi:F-type H+-transporting ATPase subunit b
MLRTRSLVAGLLALSLVIGWGTTPARAWQAGEGGSVSAPAAEAEAGVPALDAAAGHEGGAGHGGQPNILEPQIPLAFWTLVVFGLLLAVLWKFAWGPLSKALHDREHFMEETLRQAETTRAESERMLAEHRQLMDQAGQQAQSIIDEARKAALATSEEIRRAAQGEADGTLQRAQREIASAKDQALLDIWNKSADLAVSIAGKVLSRELSASDHRRLIDQAMAELPAAGARGNGSTRS